MPKVTVSPAAAGERAVLDNLMQFYVHDFSEQWAGQDRGELNAEGRFDPYPLDAYWSEAARIPLIIRVDGHIAGFALLNDIAHSGRPVDRNMAEYFVVRKHRGGGVAAEALRQILAAYPGRWEAAVAERNEAAKRFWPRAIAAAPNVTGLTRLEGDGEHWRGPIWSFDAA
jgi:predicted acetyltransferase